MTPGDLLSAEQVDEFHRNGVLVLRGFYDRAADIEPIQRGIYQIIGIVLEKAGLADRRPPFSGATFDAGFQELIAVDRRYGGEVYDAVKQIPAFVRLAASPRHDRLLSQLRQSDSPGLAAGGYGIRIDNPNEDRYRANWHQDYPAQLRSLDGLVFWSSLVPITPDLGPVVFALGSHKDGVVPVYTRDPRNPEKTAAYGLTLKDEHEVVNRYPHAAPLSDPGDLIVLDYLCLHASGENRGTRSRWSMQMRYFNFRHPSGRRIAWQGAYAAGRDLRAVHPEYVLD